jgi:hypothetical protein
MMMNAPSASSMMAMAAPVNVREIASDGAFSFAVGLFPLCQRWAARPVVFD